ncbi:MAG: hypothetical protein AAF628_06040 [Planctomycetota bacterium]
MAAVSAARRLSTLVTRGHWTMTHPLVTAGALDAQAHQNHLAALVDALLGGSTEWTTLGIPYLDGALFVSESTARPGVVAPLPQPVNVTGLATKLRNMHTCVENDKDKLDIDPDCFAP